MPNKRASLAGDLAILAGFATFFLFRGAGFLCLPPFALFLFACAKKPGIRPVASNRRCFLPFAAGLLIWPMRFFYWDRADFEARVRNLLILAALSALFFCLRRPARRWLRCFNGLGLKKRLLAIFVTVELLFILAAAVLTQRGVALVGDEPHYLAISQSLARDHDLNVFNQYFRGGFREFLDVEKLAAHGTWGKGYKRIYSYHLPGISLTLAPFFLFKLSPPLLYFLLRSFLGLFGALLAVLVYLFCLRLWPSRSLAIFFTLAFSLSAPVFFFSFHIFPEVQAMLLVLSALYLLFFKAGENEKASLWAGLLLGAAIFWGVKYALFIYPICLGFCAYWLWNKKFRPALLLLAFPLLFQALFFFYLHYAYGNFSPNSVYYGMLSPAQAEAFYDTILKKITLNMRWETLLDYFFDQRDGLLLYNPFYFFAFPGLLLALKNFRRYRLHLLAVLPALLFVLNHAFSTIRAGYCPQGRYLAPVTWALLLLVVIYYRESRNPFFKKTLLLLPLYSLFVAAYQVVQPFTLYQPTTHDTLQRTGLLFQHWSNSRIDLPLLLPSYIKTANSGYLPNTVFLGIFLLLAALSLVRGSRKKKRGRGLPACTLVFFAIFSLACLFPRPAQTDPQVLPGPRGRPCQVYFEPAPAAVGDKSAWLCSGPRCRLRIESLVPLTSVEIRVQNRSPRETLAMTVRLFDDARASWQLPPGGMEQVRLDRPAFKKIRARYGYQFELRASNGASGTGPAWLLGITPR